MEDEAYFTRDGDELVPAIHARGPWSGDMLHGRLLAGLAARAAEDRVGVEFHPARLTIDLFRSPPMESVRCAVSVVREGNRIRVLDIGMRCGDVDVARASIVLLRKAPHPEGEVWSPPPWSAPHPDDIATPGATRMGYWDARPISGGGFRGGEGPKQMWLREVRPLVSSEALTPFVRVAVAADVANPFANSGNRGLEFINADITLYLSRLPASDWLGFDVTSHTGADGVAVGQCRIYDTEGPIGHTTVCGVANRRL